ANVGLSSFSTESDRIECPRCDCCFAPLSGTPKGQPGARSGLILSEGRVVGTSGGETHRGRDMRTIRAVGSDRPGCHGEGTEDRVERPSGFRPARSAPTEAPRAVRPRGGWDVVEQFVRDGFRYRLVRRPIDGVEEEASRLTKRERQVVALAVNGH